MISSTDLFSNENNNEKVLHISFADLNKGPLNIGYRTIQKDGKDFHQVTRTITLSVQKFRDNSLINMLYVNGKPVMIQLTDQDVSPYYADYIEWRYIFKGHLDMTFDDETVRFEENEICFINSSAYHKECIPTSDCVTINISMNRNFFNESFIENINLTPLKKFIRTNMLNYGQEEKYLKFTPGEKDSASIQQDIFAIMDEARQEKPGYLDICRGHTIRIMDILSDEYRVVISRKDAEKYYTVLFQSISQFMKDNIGVISMPMLVTSFHFQENFINNLIKRYTGLTYSNYLINLRIEKAKELLTTTTLPVNEIVLLIGYNNQTFFYRRFKAVTGYTLAKFRKNYKNREGIDD